MEKEILKRVAIHEAGHFVMRWHIGLKPTPIVIIDDGTDAPNAGVLSFRGWKETCPDIEYATLAASGIAAEMLVRKMTKAERTICTRALFKNEKQTHGSKRHDSQSDAAKVFSVFKDERMFCGVFEIARSLLRDNAEKLLEAYNHTIAHMGVARRDAVEMFRRWDNDTTTMRI